MKVSLLVLAALLLSMPQACPDSVTLNTGEVVQGDILSETDTELVMMAVNYNRTITSRRTILKSDIKAVERESTQQKVERRAYEALEDRLRLDPNREFSKADYENGIEAFTNYLSRYPESKFAGDVQRRLALWKDELSHVERGEVKFADKWMIPDEKKPLVLKKYLADLQRQRDSLAAGVAGAEASLPALQNKVQSLPPTVQHPVYDSGPGPGRHHYSVSWLKEYRTESNGEWEKANADLKSCQQSIASGRVTLASLDAKIRGTRSELQQIEEAHEAALARSNQPPVEAAAAVPHQEVTEAPPAPPPPPPPKSWLDENWKWLAAGVAAFLVVGFLISRFTAHRVLLRLAEEEGRLRDQRLAKRREAEFAGRSARQQYPPDEQ
ncbi:MAG TPA: hypothetical protein VL486_15405 [Verrucomicrobiae bacterium]|nr:hypothetical protein [Verrucomicrobiae bacterium]